MAKIYKLDGNTYRCLQLLRKPVYLIQTWYLNISLTLRHTLTLLFPHFSPPYNTHTRSWIQEKLQALQGTLETSTVEDLITKQLVRRKTCMFEGKLLHDLIHVQCAYAVISRKSAHGRSTLHVCQRGGWTLF